MLIVLSGLFSSLFAASAWAAPAQNFFDDLELFRARSLVLRSERAQLDAQSTATLSRFLQFTPKVSAGIGRQNDQQTTPSGTSRSSYGYWRASADWNLFRGGADYFSWRAAREQEKAQAFQVQSQELKTELEGSKVIFRRLYLRDAQGAQAELLKLKQETMRIGRDRYAQGKVSLQDVSKMDVDLLQQQNTVRQAEIDLAENEVAYRAFFVEELKTREWPFGSGLTLTLEKPEQGSWAQKRLQSLAFASRDAWMASRLRHLPSLDLAIGYKQAPLQGSANKIWSGTLELSVPFWSRLELASENAQASAAAERAENEAAANAREEESRRDFLRKKISLSRANLEDARKNLEKSERLYQDMLRSFRLGRLSTNDLFIEQDRRIRALLLDSQARLSYHESLVEACALWGFSAQDCLR